MPTSLENMIFLIIAFLLLVFSEIDQKQFQTLEKYLQSFAEK